MKSEKGQSIAIINVMVIVGLISLAFIMSNYGVLTYVRRLTQTGADAGALAAADYLADNLTVRYYPPCPRTLREWDDVKDEITEEAVWDFYLDKHYLKYLEEEDYRWKNMVNDYLGFHRAGEYRSPELSDYSPQFFGLPNEIKVFVGAKGDSPVTSSQLYGTDSIEVHAAAQASLERVVFKKLGDTCAKVDDDPDWDYDSESSANRKERKEEEKWRNKGANASCDVDPYCDRKDEFGNCTDRYFTVECYIWIRPERFGIDVEWESKGLIK